MKVQLLVTRDDSCLPNLKHEFRELGISYQQEATPEQLAAFKARRSGKG